MCIRDSDQTDDNNHVKSENQEYIEARINLKDGSQAIYIPDNYAKYTMLFDGQESVSYTHLCLLQPI